MRRRILSLVAPVFRRKKRYYLHRHVALRRAASVDRKLDEKQIRFMIENILT
jgi:hypothetical protein